MVPAYYNQEFATAAGAYAHRPHQTEASAKVVTEDLGPQLPGSLRGELASELIPRRQRTDPTVDPSERGQETEINQHGAFAAEQERSNQTSARQTRRTVAHKLVEAMASVIANRHTVAMAASLQVLKRDLSRSHDCLIDAKSEQNYLSIVTLVESAVQSNNWKSFSVGQLRELKRAVQLGESGDVSFDDFQSVRRRLRGEVINTRPEIDLDAEAN